MERNKTGVDIMYILACFIVARFSCIALSNIPIFSMTFMFLYGCAFIMLFVLRYQTMSRREVVGLVSILFYSVYVLTMTLSEGFFNTQAFNAYILFFLYFIYLYIKRSERRKAVSLGIVMLFGYLFTYLYSIVVLFQDPSLSRKAAASIVTDNSADVINGVGGFDTVYGTLLVIAILIYLMRTRIPKTMRVLCIIVLISGIAFLIMASYGTALVLLFILCVFALGVKNKAWAVIIVMASVLFWFYRADIGFSIIRFVEPWELLQTLRDKIQDIGKILITGEAQGTLSGAGGRLARMGWSFNTFLRYPFFGGVGRLDAKIGYHSEIVDMLARFGIVGTGIFVSFLVTFFKDCRNRISSNEGKSCFVILVVLYLAIAVLNPALYTQQVLPFFVLFPLFDMFSRRGKSNDKNFSVSSL